MRLIIITLLIILSSCNKDDTYFIKLSFDKDILVDKLYIIATAKASHSVSQIDLHYKYQWSREEVKSYRYSDPIEEQNFSFSVNSISGIDTLFIIVYDTKGNYKRFDL